MFKKIKFLRKSKLDIGTKGIQQHIACSLIYLTNTAIIYLLLFKSLGVSVEIAHMFFLSVIIIFATTIPITIQGFGIREWIFVEYSKLVGISLEAGFSVAILIYLNSLMFYLLGAVPFILLRRKE